MEKFLDNVKDLTVLKEQIAKIKEFSSIPIDETKPEYKSLHCGEYKKHPLIIKDGPHGYYLDYKKFESGLEEYYFSDGTVSQKIHTDGKKEKYLIIRDNHILFETIESDGTIHSYCHRNKKYYNKKIITVYLDGSWVSYDVDDSIYKKGIKGQKEDINPVFI
jgi:hypothetical protein